MPSIEHLYHRGRRIAQRDRFEVGREIRDARVAMGISQAELGRRARMSAPQVSRVERGQLATASVDQLAVLGAAVGLDVRVRAYPGPDPSLGAPQNAVLARLADRLPGHVRIAAEVGLPIVGDQRAWDAVIHGLARLDIIVPLPADIETRFHDPQAQTRRVLLKLRDSRLDAVLLVLADTRLNRDAVGGAASLLRAEFPISPRRALAALGRGEHPGGSAIVLL
jgi:transcriptional regulator with XRE-family HTH domain